jgi:hypothetical protein
MKRFLLAATIAGLGASLAAADEIQLSNGHKITGVVSKKEAGKVIVEVGAGTITLDAKEVTAINPGHTPIHDYQDKWQGVKDSKKASDFYDLAKWAKEQKLTRYVAPLCLKTVELEPDHAAARAELHHEKMGGKWLTFEEAQTARGLVFVDDRWITKAEVELMERRRLAAKERAMAAQAERDHRREEERQARQASIDDYNARLSQAMSQLDGYYYSPSFAWTTPYFRPYWWSPYVRSRSYYQRGWEYGFGFNSVLPTIPIIGWRR